MTQIRIRPATINDSTVILELIRALADFEKLAHDVKATEDMIRSTLFGSRPAAEVIIAELRDGSSGALSGATSGALSGASSGASLGTSSGAFLGPASGEWRNAGFALYFSTYSTFLAKPGLYLEDLFVRPEFRSHGIGQKMLEELARIAVARGCGRLEWSVLNWNKRAWEFYARMGAMPMDEWTVHRVAGDALEKLARG